MCLLYTKILYKQYDILLVFSCQSCPSHRYILIINGGNWIWRYHFLSNHVGRCVCAQRRIMDQKKNGFSGIKTERLTQVVLVVICRMMSFLRLLMRIVEMMDKSRFYNATLQFYNNMLFTTIHTGLQLRSILVHLSCIIMLLQCKIPSHRFHCIWLNMTMVWNIWMSLTY